MSYRKKVKAEVSDIVDVQYQNKFAQIASLVGPCRLFGILGRGSAKTTDIQVERLIDIMYDMPGAPCAWVADTFSNLTANVLPAVLEGLERKGFREGIHYVIEKEPPTFTDKEKEALPDWLRPHFWKPFNKLVSYKRTIIFFTGMNVRFGSLDRPSSLAGSSVVHLFGDEAKYFKEEKIANQLKAVRGYRTQYGHSVYYRGVTFTSDIADPSHIGEYDWMRKEARNMNIDKILLIMKVGLVYNEALQEFIVAKQEYQKNPTAANATTYKNKLKTANLWKARWVELRRMDDARTFFLRASSYVNVDILTEGWFADAIAADFNDLRTAILSCKPSLKSGDRFYAALGEQHFYKDGIDEEAYDQLGLLDKEDCRVLKYLNLYKPLHLGIDFGNMCSLSVAQEDRVQGRECLRVLKFLHTLAPEYLVELGEKFRNYFAPMQNKTVHLFYDRAGNSYKMVQKDQATEFKRAIERDKDGKRTGWTVILESIGQGNIGQPEEYDFMLKLLSGSNPRLPIILIDYYAAKHLRQSLEGARTKIKSGVVFKDKRSEQLPIDQLPSQSTNPSDSFKYLLMTKQRRKIAKGKVPIAGTFADPSIV